LVRWCTTADLGERKSHVGHFALGSARDARLAERPRAPAFLPAAMRPCKVGTMDLGIRGRVALVGGASQGIGRAVAEVLVQEGARVVITARDSDRTANVAAEIGAAAGLGWDSADLDAAPALIERITDEVGPIDILVTNTGGPPSNPDPLGLTREQWELAHRTLVLSPITLLQLVLPGMRERGWGRVVGIASTSVREPIEPLILSTAERAATFAAYKTLARAVAGDGITINTLLTGYISTERAAALAGSMEAAESAAAQSVPARRIGRPEEMGWAAAFLCSDRAAYITGTALAVDGGALHLI
jgi:3-oxoacyl-[acyl-carrier protein] reductase